MKTFSKILIPSILAVLATIIIGTNIDKPFWGEHDWNGARYGNIAKNYVRYGYIATKLGQIENGGISTPQNFIYYTHYQPLLPILISLSYRVFGISELATRLVPLAATVGFVIVLYFIGEMLGGIPMGIFSSVLALATPMVRYFGKNPVHEPLALLFSSLAFLGLIKKNKWLVITGIVLTALTNWSFVFLVAGISLFILSKKNIKKIIWLWTLVFFLVGLHFLHIKILTGSFLGGNLIGALLERTSVGQVIVKFNIFQYLMQIRLWASTLFTNTLLASALIGLVLLVRSKLNNTKMFILAIFVYCLYPLFFANASFVHSYFIYYFVFPISLLGGFFLAQLYKYKKVLLLVCLLVVAGIWFERNGYVMALNTSDGDNLAVQISETIKQETNSQDVVLVEPFDYEYSRLPILSFYSERNIIAAGKSDWIVNVAGDKYVISKINIRK